MKLLLLLGFGWATVARGQGVAPAEPRFYVGLQACYMHYPGLGLNLDGPPARMAIYPAMGTVGYRLANDFWVEASFTGFSTTRHESAGGDPAEYWNVAYAAAVLVRARVAAVPRTSPWAVDVVGGVVRLSSGQEVSNYSQNGSAGSSQTQTGIKDVQLALGVGGRYRLSRHWQLTADAQGQLSVIGLVVNSIFGSNNLPVGGGLTAGVRYSF